jgi:cyclophilin family peptidyl-prolyl cis-trans isomerase
VAQLGLMSLWFGAGLLGCGGSPPEKPEKPKPAQAGVVNPQVTVDPRFKLPFREATIQQDAAPDGQTLPDMTLTGKSVGKLFVEVSNLWDKVSLTSNEGKLLRHTATLETDLGNIEIEFLPDLAPNHVRSFLTLAKAGYYDGLVFERTSHEESDVQKGATLDYIEAGCPMGSGEPTYGSIGYWLRPELSDKVQHEPGTVGAWHGEEADTAACKFYITLTKAPAMDGHFTVFGKVTKGLDVAQKILKQPIRPDDENKDRPEKPVVIKKVTIQSKEVN